MQRFLKEILLYCCVIWLVNLGIGYYLKTYETIDLHNRKQFYPKLRWQDFYQRDQNIELLILGSSHAYRAYDPQVIGAEMGIGGQVFNFGSSAQSPLNSYFVLNEVLQDHHPKQVVMDLYFMVFTADHQLRNRRFNWQDMKSGKAKSTFFWNGFSSREQVCLQLFPAFVYKDYLKNKFNKLLGRSNLSLSKGNYQGDGFVSNIDTLALNSLKYNNQFDVFKPAVSSLTKEHFNYLKKIRQLCDQHQVELIFTTSPMPEISIEKIQNYASFYQLFDDLAKELNVPFVDYNIDRIPKIEDQYHYYDDDHLNAAGAKLFSKKVSEDLRKFKNN